MCHPLFLYYFFKFIYTGSLPKWLPWWELSQSEVRGQELLQGLPEGYRVSKPSSIAFPAQAGSGWEVEQPGLELAPIRDPGTCKYTMSL